MNLRNYYQRVRTIREGLSEPFVYLTSASTTNGGKAGIVTEVERSVAARMIADGTAEPSKPEEIEAYLAECAQRRAEAKEEEIRNRLRVTLVNESDIRLEPAKLDRTPKRG